MTPGEHQIENEKFVAELSKLLGDKGLLAALRKWWSPATRHHAYPVLGRLRALKDPRKELLAALYAVHATKGNNPHVPGGPSIGAAALKLAGGSKSPAFESMERHFKRLLAAKDLDELAPQLHRLVKRLERESVPLDYAGLLKDLRLFRDYSEGVKTRWALHFWQADEPEALESPSA